MPASQIKLIEVESGNKFPAAAESSVLQSSANLGWRGLNVELHNLPPMELPEHVCLGERLLVHVGRPILFEWKSGGSRQYRKELKTDDFCLQAHGDLNAPSWSQNLKMIAIALEPQFVQRVFQDSARAAGTINFRARRCESDPVVSDFARRFITEVESASYQGKLYGESLAMAFSMHLLEKHSNLERGVKLPAGKLTSSQLRRTLEFIHENLHEDLSIEQLADQAYLSAFHFARLFKNTLKLTPHQYVLQNRIERAKRLITKSPYSNLTEIGLSVGFFDQAHFTKSFKKVVGTTPKIYLKHAA
jgi:AraC family transcriptional regulator